MLFQKVNCEKFFNYCIYVQYYYIQYYIIL